MIRGVFRVGGDVSESRIIIWAATADIASVAAQGAAAVVVVFGGVAVVVTDDGPGVGDVGHGDADGVVMAQGGTRTAAHDAAVGLAIGHAVFDGERGGAGAVGDGGSVSAARDATMT